jgi:hypothetical protein
LMMIVTSLTDVVGLLLLRPEGGDDFWAGSIIVVDRMGNDGGDDGGSCECETIIDGAVVVVDVSNRGGGVALVQIEWIVTELDDGPGGWTLLLVVDVDVVVLVALDVTDVDVEYLNKERKPTIIRVRMEPTHPRRFETVRQIPQQARQRKVAIDGFWYSSHPPEHVEMGV